MPRPATRAQTYDALGRTPGSRLARTKRCRDLRPGFGRTTLSAVTAPRGPPSPHRRVSHVGSGPPDPARRHRGRLGLVGPAVPWCGAPQPGGGCWTQAARQGRQTARPGRATRPRVRLSAVRRDDLSPETEQSPAGLRDESAQASAWARGGIRSARGYRTRAVHGSDMPGVRHGREEPCKVRRSLRPNPRTSPRARGERPGRPTLGAAQWRPFDERASHDVGGDVSRQSSPKRFFVQVSIGPGRVYIYITGRNPANRYDVFGIARSLACIDLQMHPLA